MTANDDSNKAEWENPNNWTSPWFYFSKRDTRWIVPKRNPVMGWTFNIGQPKGAWAMIFSLLLPSLILFGELVFRLYIMGSH